MPLSLPSWSSGNGRARGVLFAGLLPVALVLHELGYFLARTACGRDGTLEMWLTVSVAVIVGAAWSLALVPLLARSSGRPRGLTATLVISVAFLTIFLSQEAMESLILGDDLAAAQATLAVLAPLCLILGAMGARLSRVLFKVAVAIVVAAGGRRRERRWPASAESRDARGFERGPDLKATPLAFGLARRPPPVLA